MNTIEVVQGSDAWLRARAGLITASKIADVMSKGKGSAESLTRAKYRAQIIAERLTGEPQEDIYQSAAMIRGTEQEPFGRASYEALRGLLVDQVGIVLHPTIERAGASPDGLVDVDGGLELKCPNTTTHINNIVRATVPPEYVPQIQWGMACTGRAWWDFASYDNRLPAHLSLFVVRVPRDDEFIALAEAAVRAFDAEVEEFIETHRKEVA
jgi:putative phage-type endonuclease